MTQPMGLGMPGLASNRVTPVVTFTDSASSTVDAASYSFASRAIGTADANRYVVVLACFVRGAAVTISSVTIGGVTATQLAQSNVDANRALGIYILPVAAGSTATIVVNTSATAVRGAIGVWSLVGQIEEAVVASSTTTTDAGSMNLAVSTKDVLFAVSTAASSGSCTWTGVTEGFDLLVEGQYISGAAVAITADESSRSINANWSGSPTNITSLAVRIK